MNPDMTPVWIGSWARFGMAIPKRRAFDPLSFQLAGEKENGAHWFAPTCFASEVLDGCLSSSQRLVFLPAK